MRRANRDERLKIHDGRTDWLCLPPRVLLRMDGKTGRQSSATTPTLQPSNTQAASYLPTLKAKEQAALDRLWGGDDPEDDASDEAEASQ